MSVHFAVGFFFQANISAARLRGNGAGDAASFDITRTSMRLDVSCQVGKPQVAGTDRKSTRLNSSHSQISYAVFCLKKKIVESTDLRDHNYPQLDPQSTDLRHLREAGLVRIPRYLIRRTRSTLATLTNQPRTVLDPL